MPNTLQDFLAVATQKAADDLKAALLRLPEDKRDWCPMAKARTALDQVAECALLNGGTVDLIRDRIWPKDFDFAAFEQSKVDLTRNEAALLSLLEQNTAKVIAAMHTVPDDELGSEIQMPWGSMPLAQLLAYPYWNMSYHEGQINYIASMVGCL